MAWYWRADTRQGVRVDAQALGLDQRFPAQGEAESWLGEAFPDLAEAGVTAVSLYEDERLVYGPMGLEPEAS